MIYELSEVLSIPKDTCLVLGLLEDNALSEEIVALDKKLNGLISRMKNRLKKAGNVLIQSEVENGSLILIHCGTQNDFKLNVLTKYVLASTNQLLAQQATNALFSFPRVTECEPDYQLEQMIQTIDAVIYTQPLLKTEPPRISLTNAAFYLPNATALAITQGSIIAKAIHHTRTLADLPANICTPSYLCKTAEQLALTHKNLNCRIFNEKEIEELKMGGLIAVGKGSKEPPRFIELTYSGTNDNNPPIILVGKGVTFDAGGISLKPPPLMNEMKYDMAGAASVLGTLQACAELNLPLNVIGLIPSVENLPSGQALKPGDVITMMSGHTVEVLNTDAEGRLILADALTYAERYEPKFVIDIATLTGAVIVALGNTTTGLMTNDEVLATEILQAADVSLDRTWRLPLFADFAENLESPIADMINAGFDRTAGSIIAGAFLANYTKKYRWAHLDIAGTAWISGNKRVATGRPVPLLVELLRRANTTY